MGSLAVTTGTAPECDGADGLRDALDDLRYRIEDVQDWMREHPAAATQMMGGGDTSEAAAAVGLLANVVAGCSNLVRLIANRGMSVDLRGEGDRRLHH